MLRSRPVAVALLIFWSVLAGIILAELLPLPPLPRGPTLWAVLAVIALGLGRAVAMLRRAG